MTMANNGVVCIGLTVTDILVRPVDQVIQNREINNVEEIACAVGGDAYNEAYALTRMGVPVKLMSSVGNDMWGDFIIKKGTEAGIDMGHVTRNRNYPTTVTIVLIQGSGERSFICAGGSALHFQMESLDLPSIEKARVVSLASLYSNAESDSAFLAAAKAAKNAGAIVTADTILNMKDCTLESNAEIFPLLDFIFPNYDEASAITGEKSLDKIADAFLKTGIGNVVIKTGQNGCYIQNSNVKLNVPTYKKAQRVDTTGAGDNFAAGFIYGLSKDLSIRECAAYANAAASVSIQYTGAGGLKNLQEVEDMMAGGILEISQEEFPV